MQKMIYNDPVNGSGMDRVVRVFGYVPSKGMSDEPLAVVSFFNEDERKWRRLTWVPVSSLRPAPEKEGETDEKA